MAENGCLKIVGIHPYKNNSMYSILGISFYKLKKGEYMWKKKNGDWTNLLEEVVALRYVCEREYGLCAINDIAIESYNIRPSTK